MRFAADCDDDRPADRDVDTEDLVLLEGAPQHILVDTHLCLVVACSRCDLLIVLIVDGGALKGGFEVRDVGHFGVEMQAEATGSKQ
jgi:hypothetical protein